MSSDSLIQELRERIQYLRERLREHDCAPGDEAIPSCPQDKPCTVCRLESALDELQTLKADDRRVTMQYGFQQVIP